MTCKELGSCHSCPYNKKKLAKLKTNDFSQTYQGGHRAICHPKVWRVREIQTVTAKDCLPRADTAGSYWWEHINGSVDELLQAECNRHEKENFLGTAVGAGAHFHWLYLHESHQLLTTMNS